LLSQVFEIEGACTGQLAAEPPDVTTGRPEQQVVEASLGGVARRSRLGQVKAPVLVVANAGRPTAGKPASASRRRRHAVTSADSRGGLEPGAGKRWFISGWCRRPQRLLPDFAPRSHRTPM